MLSLPCSLPCHPHLQDHSTLLSAVWVFRCLICLHLWTGCCPLEIKVFFCFTLFLESRYWQTVSKCNSFFLVLNGLSTLQHFRPPSPWGSQWLTVFNRQHTLQGNREMLAGLLAEGGMKVCTVGWSQTWLCICQNTSTDHRIPSLQVDWSGSLVMWTCKDTEVPRELVPIAGNLGSSLSPWHPVSSCCVALELSGGSSSKLRGSK